MKIAHFDSPILSMVSFHSYVKSYQGDPEGTNFIPNFKASTIWNQSISESTERNGISVPFAHSTTAYARYGRNSLEVHVYVVLTPSFPGGKKCSWKLDIQWMLFFLGKAAFSKQHRQLRQWSTIKLNAAPRRGQVANQKTSMIKG